jgi:hypothetical protein
VGSQVEGLERVISVQPEAVDAAIRFADASGEEGKSSVVLFQKSKTKFEKIWTYAQSAYPPARSDSPMVEDAGAGKIGGRPRLGETLLLL